MQLDVYQKKKKELDTYLTPYTKTNPRSTIVLNLRAKPTEHLGENIGIHFCDLRLDNSF